MNGVETGVMMAESWEHVQENIGWNGGHRKACFRAIQTFFCPTMVPFWPTANGNMDHFADFWEECARHFAQNYSDLNAANDTQVLPTSLSASLPWVNGFHLHSLGMYVDRIL